MQRYLMLFAVVALGLAACSGSDEPADTTAGETTAAPETTQATSSGEQSGSAAKDGDQVAVHYTGTLDDGTEFDSSRNREPLEFVVGSDQVIAGFDAAVRGMAVGDVTTVRIPPEEAYGLTDPELIFPVPIEEAPDDVAIGDDVLIGGVVQGRVTEITDTEVIIDTNHRFAGQALTFEIELVSINA